MVNNVTSLTGNGLKDWIIQRITAVYFAYYAVFLLGFIILHPHMQYEQWQMLFHLPLFKIATVAALGALALHSWVGIWTVTTDYLKCTVVRLSVQMLVFAWLVGQFIWGLMIVWGQ
ncbi:succinate dehydrogenase, hydrophobic membrane anchor protein [Legionella dresdenensis]|uniref:Succinate dehydrogenase hydrophobic membrane anchor subunit n=1 Tax=Legionella dresdenensis TaxID=450200 RepID=A0ABV8CEV4_9GAMM